MPHILAIDDDRTVLRLIEKSLLGSNVKLTCTTSAEEGLPILTEGKVDVCLLDIMLPEMDGLELARRIREIDARLPVIFITSLDDSDTAIEAMKYGAYEFCMKPLDIKNVQDLVERAMELRRLMATPVDFSDELPKHNADLLVGKSPQMVEVYKQIGRIAGQQVPVLIRGESGTGKELVARAIYQHSHRRDQCYLAINCAALSDTLLESELFGHEKGAFTGADRKHVGKFEQCNDGSIFLDEIGDMSPLLQSKILRLLQEQTFERVGGSQTIKTDARIISATNRDLEVMIEDNEFRLDLFHRINAFEIYLPPLRERGDDIVLLVNYFINRCCQQLNKSIEGISPEALKRIREYSWPGNVRELHSVIRRAIVMATGPVITPDCLGDELSDEPKSGQSKKDEPESGGFERFWKRELRKDTQTLYADSLEIMERRLITTVLAHTGGNQSKAAEILGITRSSLRNKIRSLNIVIEQVVSADQEN